MILNDIDEFLTIIAGRTGSGKSVFLRSLAREKAEQGKKILYVDGEFFFSEKAEILNHKNILFLGNMGLEDFLELDERFKDRKIDYLFIDAIDVMRHRNLDMNSSMGKKSRELRNFYGRIRKSFPQTIVSVQSNGGLERFGYGIHNEYAAYNIFNISRFQDNNFDLVEVKNRKFEKRQFSLLLEKIGNEYGFKITSEKYKVFEWEFWQSGGRLIPNGDFDFNKSLYENLRGKISSKRIKKIYDTIELRKDFTSLNTWIFMTEMYGDNFDINYFDTYLNNINEKTLTRFPPNLNNYEILNRISCKKMFDWINEDGELLLDLLLKMTSIEATLPKGYSINEIIGKNFNSLKKSHKSVCRGYEIIRLINKEKKLKDFFEGQELILKEENIFAPQKLKDLILVGEEFKNCIKTDFFIKRLDGKSHLVTLDNKYCVHFNKNGKILGFSDCSDCS